MTNEELKRALVLGHPVVVDRPRLGSITYRRVNVIIYRLVRGQIAVSGELLDRSRRSVTIVPAKDIREPTSEDDPL